MAPRQPQLGRLIEHIQTPQGVVVPGVSYTVRRPGATVDSDQSGTSPFTINVTDVGGVKSGDVVAINEGTTTYTVDSVSIGTSPTITLSGFVGTLELTDDDRITPTTPLPALFVDDGSESASNPLTTSATGVVKSWTAGGYYDVFLTGGGVSDELVKDLYIPLLPPWHVSYASRYGAQFDNSTDDYSALQRCLDEAALDLNRGQGGYVLMPKGVAKVSQGLTVWNRVRLVGMGSRNTGISATAGFSFDGLTDAVVTLDHTPSAGMGCRLEHAWVECSDVANSIGVYCEDAEEDSGVFHAIVTDFKVKGIYYAGGQQFRLEDVATYHSVTGGASSAIGLDLVSDGGSQHLSNISCTSNDGVTATTDSQIRLTGGGWTIEAIHLEEGAVGIEATGGANGTMSGITAPASGSGITTLITLADRGWKLDNIFAGDATNHVNDTSTGGPGIFAMGLGTTYEHSNDTQGGESGIICQRPGVINRILAKRKFKSDIIINKGSDTAMADPLNATAFSGNIITLTGTGVSTDTITVNSDTANPIILICGGGADATFNEGGNLQLAGTFVMAPTDTLMLVHDGTTWYEISRSNN